MNISEPFIRRPIATSLLSAALLIAGLTAYLQLPVSPLPKLDIPTINVSAGLPGASPETMASAVATPLERRFGRIAGVTEITSVSSLGTTSLTLQFDLDRDVDAAARDVQAAINAAGGELPANLPIRPSYRKVNPSDGPIMILAATSETLTLGQVFDAANSVLAQKISQVSGVGQVTVSGAQAPAVRVQVDPAALAGMGLGMEDVRTVLQTANVNLAKGSLQGPQKSYIVSADDQLFGAEAYRKLIIAKSSSSPDGYARLGDVAHVFDDVENNKVAAWSDGKRGISLMIRRQPGANIIQTIEAVKSLLPRMAASISPAIKLTILIDRTQTIRASVRDVEITLAISIMLVVLVVFLFLRSLWATVIPSIAVPLSLVGTFGVMYLCDYNLDNLSLMALTISTGFVVDDAIVMIENVSRYIEMGDPPLMAALKGARQVGFTIVTITLSLLAVFIPILLMGGLIGRLFREFSITLAVAVSVSAVVSLTLTPMMCGLFLRSEKDKKHGRAYLLLERFFDGMLRGYEHGLKWVLRHEHLMLFVTAATVGLTIYLYIIVPKGLFPQQDTGMLMGASQAAQDISFIAMRDKQHQLGQIVLTDPDVDHVVSFMGAGGNTGNTGNLFIALKPWPPRRTPVDQIIARLRPRLARVEGITLYLQAIQDLRVGGRQSRTQYQYSLQDANLDELNKWTPKVLAKLKTLKQLKDVATDQQTGGLQAGLQIDRDTASRLSILPAAIDNALYDAFGQRQVSTIYTQLNQYHVVMEVKPEYQETPDDLRQIYVKSQSGSQVPLSAITHYSPSMTALSINHQGQFPANTLSFNLAPGVALGDAVDAVHKAEQEIGMPHEIHAGFAGTAEVFRSSLASQPLLILAALVAVYIVLGMLYESYIHPITILSTLPSAGVGALLALMLTGTDFSVIALIGIILLIGIVKKNAIMMIDFAIEAERDQGLSSEESIYQACVLRFRPIMMTTMAALLGGLPLCLGSGTGSELRRPLGIAIVGGLIFSQMLTLFTTPVVYLAMDKLAQRWKRPARTAGAMAV